MLELYFDLAEAKTPRWTGGVEDRFARDLGGETQQSGSFCALNFNDGSRCLCDGLRDLRRAWGDLPDKAVLLRPNVDSPDEHSTALVPGRCLVRDVYVMYNTYKQVRD